MEEHGAGILFSSCIFLSQPIFNHIWLPTNTTQKRLTSISKKNLQMLPLLYLHKTRTCKQQQQNNSQGKQPRGQCHIDQPKQRVLHVHMHGGCIHGNANPTQCIHLQAAFSNDRMHTSLLTDPYFFIGSTFQVLQQFSPTH